MNQRFITDLSALERTVELRVTSENASLEFPDRTQQVSIHSGVWIEEPWKFGDSEQLNVTLLKDYRACVSQIGESEFTIVVTHGATSLAINVPYGFVEEIWQDVAGVVTLSLARKIGVTLNRTRLFLERRPLRT